MENKFARFMRNTGPARFFVPLGIALIVFGILMFVFNNDSYLETVGTVTEVVETLNAENNKVYDVSVSFTVDGKKYDCTFTEQTKEYKAGDDIKVYYDPEDPTKTSPSKTGILPPVLIGLGVVALVAGVLMTVKAYKKSNELDKTPKADPAVFEGFKQAAGVT